MAPPPSPSLLEGLHLHLFEEICEHLAADSSDKRSLPALSLTCKGLYSATARVLYRSIQIEFYVNLRESPDGYLIPPPRPDWDLTSSSKKWLERLRDRGCASYVQRLTILEKKVQKEGPSFPLDIWPRNVWGPDALDDRFPFTHRAWPLDRNDEFWARPESAPYSPHTKVLSEEEAAASLLPWLTLADHLIPSLSGLKDVYYQCQDQIPAHLLKRLDQHPNGVRLHMDTFSLRSLYQERGRFHDIQAEEYRLATSSCLSSIRVEVPIRGIDYEDRICFNEDAIWEMVGGLAPNLKSVSMDWVDMAEEEIDPEDEDWEMPRPEWPGFFSGRPSGKGEQRKGALESLSFGTFAPLNPEIVSIWSRCTDFDALRSLHLRTSTVDAEVLKSLSEIAEAGGFKSLRCLSIWTEGDPFHPSNPTEGRAPIDPEVARLLRALRPLDTLDIHGIFADETLGAVLGSHGKSVRRLRLIPVPTNIVWPSPYVFTSLRVEELVRACPDVRDLELLIPRTKSDEAEARIYHTLAGLRRLDRLSLLLDCADESPVEEFDELDVEYITPYFLRDSIINFTIRAPLAADIFEALCEHRSPRLIRLMPVRIGHIGMLYHSSVMDLGSVLARTWIRVRDAREGREEEFDVAELQAREKTHWPEDRRLYLGLLVHYPGMKEIWPTSNGSVEGDMTVFRLWKEE